MKNKLIVLFIAALAVSFCAAVYPAVRADAADAPDFGNALLKPEKEVVKKEKVYVPIIMYHMISSDVHISSLAVTPQQLESDLKYLSEKGYHAVFMSDIIDFVYDNKPLPENPIVLTFDDGYYNNYLYAMPLLEKYDMKMVLSIIGESADEWSAANWPANKRYGHLTWAQICEMVKTGRVELANHTYDMHKDGPRVGAAKKRGEDVESYKKALSKDLLTFQAQIKSKCGKAPECFTYPFGNKSDVSDEVLKELGFKATLSCWGGVNNVVSGDKNCLYSMKRCNRTADRPVSSILQSLAKEMTEN